VYGGGGAEFIARNLDRSLHSNSQVKGGVGEGGGIVNEPRAGNLPETWV
jgi:hypothetical protein